MKMSLRGLTDNRKGIYEFVLTKSVMLIFILALVSIFYSLYNSVNVKSAGTIADSESDRVAREVDDVIALRGVSNKVRIHLQPGLKVGKQTVPYKLEVTENGNIVVSFLQAPYDDVVGISTFGLSGMDRTSGRDRVTCDWKELQWGAYFDVTKESDYVYYPYGSGDREGLYYRIKVTIDAADKCGDYMVFEGEYRA